MKRRSFIAGSTLAGLGVIGACKQPEIETKKTTWSLPSDGSTIGHGSHKYIVDKKWGNQDPGRYPVHHCHEMVMDKNGRLIMCTTDIKNNIIVYDKDGSVLTSWGTEYPGAHGLTIKDEGGEEFIYLTDTITHEVYKFTMDGKKILTLTFPEASGLYDQAAEFVPTETVVLENGDILIADGYGKDYILRYDQNGNFKDYFGGNGDEDHQLKNAHGICIDNRSNDPTLLVTSRATQSFKRFTLDGKHLETYHLPGCWICRPVIAGENLYFAVIVTKDWWSYDGMVAVLDKNNKVVSFPGGSAPKWADDKLTAPDSDGLTFMNPHDVCVDNDDNLYIPQWFSGKTYPIKLQRTV